jgi:hypothetical protein
MRDHRATALAFLLGSGSGQGEQSEQDTLPRMIHSDPTGRQVRPRNRGSGLTMGVARVSCRKVCSRHGGIVSLPSGSPNLGRHVKVGSGIKKTPRRGGAHR